MKVDLQTALNIVLSLITVYLALKNFALTSRKDTQRESQEMTEIKVQLTQLMGMMRDIQKDVRTSNADFRALSEKVAVMDTKLTAAFTRIDEMKKELANGK